MSTKRSMSRRGSAYVMVLAISLLVAVIGVAALTAVRVQLRTSANSSDAEDARVLAQSGVEWVRALINLDPNWRTNYTSGSSATIALGGGSFTASAADPVDNDYTNSPLDPIRINVTGFKGRARQKVTVTLAPSLTANTCLNAAMSVAGVASFTSGTVTGGLIATNSNMVLTGSTKMDTNVEATGTFSGTSYYASKTSGVAARQMPDSTAFDYYIRNGTSIPYPSGKDLANIVLSPASNPYGTANPLGIYVMDCADKTVNVKNVRVVGTLVLLNPKNDSTVDLQVNFAPAVPNYPTLMVLGSITFSYDNTSLTEGASKNFNPPGTPYNGVSNLTTTDTYPSILNGLVYVSGNLILKNNNTLGGPLIVGGTMTSANNLTVKYDSTYLNSPPPGFFDVPPMKVSASTWAQTVD